MLPFISVNACVCIRVFSVDKHAKDPLLINVKVKKLNYTNEFEFVEVPLLDPDKLISYLIEAGLKIPQQQVEFFGLASGPTGRSGLFNPRRPQSTSL